MDKAQTPVEVGGKFREDNYTADGRLQTSVANIRPCSRSRVEPLSAISSERTQARSWLVGQPFSKYARTISFSGVFALYAGG
jgi:hypothetical protein